MTGAAKNCVATTFAAPSRRRRDLIKREAEEEATQLDAPAVKVQGECEGDNVCVTGAVQEPIEEAAGEDVADAVNDVVEEVVEAFEQVVEQAVRTEEVDSGAAQTTLALAVVTLAFLN